jgi:TPR repeat protein
MSKLISHSKQLAVDIIITISLLIQNYYRPILEPYGGKEAAILYYERAARLNNDQAQSKLGSIYEHGLYGESMNFARAFDYYEQAAINGNAKAMLGLCRLNNRGSHGPGDQNEATRLENDVSGWLAGTPVNEDLAFSWCEKAAKAGNVDALALLGWFYECGFGQPRDFGRAEKYYELAAEKGDLGAKSRLLKSNKSITKQQHEGITGTSGDKVSANKKKRKNNSSGYVKQQHNSCKCM